MKKSLLLLLLLISFSSFSQCDFDRKADKFKNEISFNQKGLTKLSFIKYIRDDNQSVYYLSIHTTGSIATVSGKGVYLLFKDGSKIIRESVEIDVEVNDGNYYGTGDYEYSAFITLSQNDIEILKKSPVTDFKLYIFEDSLPETKQDSHITMQCIIDAK